MDLEWTYKRIYWKIRKFMDVKLGMHINRKKYYKMPILSVSQTNDTLKEMILSGKPFAAGRIGGTEIRAMVQCQPQMHDAKQKDSMRSLMICLSGFYGDLEDLDRFSRLMEKSLGSMDLLGIWFNQMEDYLIHHYGNKNMKLGLLAGLEPWYCPETPWSAALQGKRVVVIHPFRDSILTQYEKREHLFPGTDLLPEFDLRCVKAVQTLMGQEDSRFPTWFDALDYMYEEAMKEPFDIALIACGAYGLPLAARLRDAGKQAIHMGGALQLLFGVKGKRWDDFDKINCYYSEYWQSPLPSDQLNDGNGNNVENGCYW